ncbi:MAG: SurA N-terminal domain-containing protein [Zoogloeaceae bacterium]|jgi:peptidyl-prolyl cis-trans isomerase D|nr:SurA N-terminal domain-containing protein [Zoogloeaceae bacterium]
MFDAVRNNKRIVQGFLLLITLPFVFWGVDSYFRGGGGAGEVARVGDSPVSQQEFAQTLREQQDRLREQAGADFNPALFDTPEAREAVLDALVVRRLLLLHAAKSNFAISDAELIDVIGSIPALQENGQFSKQRYVQALQAQGLTQTGFEAQVRQDLTQQQLVRAVSDTALVSNAAIERIIAIQLEERLVSEAIIQPAQHAAQVKLAADAAATYYEKNRKQFEIPQQIRAEFVVLSRDGFAEQIKITPEEIRSAYEKDASKYAKQEERRASHILIESPADAPEAEQKAARAKAEALLEQVKKNPADFARLAKEHSQDPGSAVKGGDLGFFTRDGMVKPFADAAFSLKENQISGVVRSEFGFHIIQLTGIRPGNANGFEEARHAIEAELKLAAAARKFAEAVETFSNTVYEQPDSLKPAAEMFKLPVQQTGFFDPANRTAAGPLAGNEKLFSALFADDALKNRRNTDAVEVAPNTLVAARVAEVKPAELRSFESVKAEIEKMLVAEETARLTYKDGEDKLARLNGGEAVPLTWGPVQTIGRQPMRGLPADVQRAIFAVKAGKLPAYTGVRLPGGAYGLFRVSEIRSGGKGSDDARRKVQRAQLTQLIGMEDFNAYLEALRERYGVQINRAALERGESGGE